MFKSLVYTLSYYQQKLCLRQVLVQKYIKAY